MIITLPWPDRKLSPNARVHWRAKAGPKQQARISAGWATVAAKGFAEAKERLCASDGPIPLTITFYPPDRRHRDDDNMVGAFKSLRDGIADALGVNDRRFRPHYVFEDAEKPGRIEVAFPRLIPGGLPCDGDSGAVENERAGLRQPPRTGPDHNTCSGGADGSTGQ